MSPLLADTVEKRILRGQPSNIDSKIARKTQNRFNEPSDPIQKLRAHGSSRPLLIVSALSVHALSTANVCQRPEVDIPLQANRLDRYDGCPQEHANQAARIILVAQRCGFLRQALSSTPVIGYINGASATEFPHLLAGHRGGRQTDGKTNRRSTMARIRFCTAILSENVDRSCC